MLRNLIAPARFFVQISTDIVRHPRLSSDAKCLLLWQVSLPPGADEPLSESARRAGIKKTAFMRAKRELMAEGYVHEWRRPGARGRWSTTQLLSNVPLTPEEAVAVRDGQPAAPPTASPQAVGRPKRKSVGRPQEKTAEHTPHPPHPLTERGADALAAVSYGERRLRLSGRDIRQLAPLAAEWLTRGATPAELREALTSGLPDVVHSPAGLARDRLTRKMPPPAPERAPRPQPLRRTAAARPDAAAAVHDVSGAVAATKRGMAAIREALGGCRGATAGGSA